MVFTWVNTGVVEPYLPQVSTQLRVPKPYGNQRSSEVEDEHHSKTNQPNPGIMPLPQDVYKSNEKTTEPGEKVSFIYEIMSSPVFTLSIEETLASVQSIFAKKKFRHIPIKNMDESLVGIISDRDILRALAEDIPSNTNIKELMKMRVLTTISDATIRESAKVMINERIGCLPVLSSTQTIIGIITRSDILRLIINKPRINTFA